MRICGNFLQKLDKTGSPGLSWDGWTRTMPSSEFSFKASKDSSLEQFAIWMKNRYSEPRQPGQRGAVKIKDGMNPKTWIPGQIESILKTGKISAEFSAEIKQFNQHQKYSSLTQQEIDSAFKKNNPSEYERFSALIEKAREDALKLKLSEEKDSE